jgi:hypothetical protein
VTDRRSTLLYALLLVGCARGLSSPREADPAPPRPTERLLVWSGGERYDLYPVTVDADSLRGTRWPASPACDSCRVALLRSRVDSARVIESDQVNSNTALMLGSVAAIFLIIKFFPRPD